jgi:hypothetical protein
VRFLLPPVGGGLNNESMTPSKEFQRMSIKLNWTNCTRRKGPNNKKSLFSEYITFKLYHILKM